MHARREGAILPFFLHRADFDIGDVLAGPVYDKEAVITADIDLSDAIRGKYDLDVVGHYARPDIFSLSVNETVQRPVNYQAEIAREDATAEIAKPNY